MTETFSIDCTRLPPLVVNPRKTHSTKFNDSSHLIEDGSRRQSDGSAMTRQNLPLRFGPVSCRIAGSRYTPVPASCQAPTPERNGMKSSTKSVTSYNSFGLPNHRSPRSVLRRKQIPCRLPGNRRQNLKTVESLLASSQRCWHMEADTSSSLPGLVAHRSPLPSPTVPTRLSRNISMNAGSHSPP